MGGRLLVVSSDDVRESAVAFAHQLADLGFGVSIARVSEFEGEHVVSDHVLSAFAGAILIDVADCLEAQFAEGGTKTYRVATEHKALDGSGVMEAVGAWTGRDGLGELVLLREAQARALADWRARYPDDPIALSEVHSRPAVMQLSTWQPPVRRSAELSYVTMLSLLLGVGILLSLGLFFRHKPEAPAQLASDGSMAELCVGASGWLDQVSALLPD